MTEVVFWGATGQAKVLHEALLGTEYRLTALFDNRSVPSPFKEIPLFVGNAGFDHWLAERTSIENLYFCVAIGGGCGRDRLTIHDRFVKHGLAPLTVIHRTAFIAADAVLGKGCQILAQTAVCTHARLGRGVIINTAASVDHDCLLGDGVHVGPGARLAGEVTVGAGAFIGMGAVVLPRICIGEDAVVGAGAVVTKNIPAGAVMVGIPARQQFKN